MKNCIIPGSFDPVTAGHASLFETAAGIFDNVYPVILTNAEKKGGFFTPEERLELLNAAVLRLRERGITNVFPKLYSGLTTAAARELDAKYIVKGVRNTTDFAYEYELAEISRRFDGTLETVFLPSRATLACVSSTYVRELIRYGNLDSADLADGTSELIARMIKK